MRKTIINNSGNCLNNNNLPTKNEVEKIIMGSKKIQKLIINENENIKKLLLQNETKLRNRIDVINEQKQIAFRNKKTEGFLQLSVMYWQTFAALNNIEKKDFENYKFETPYCNEIRKLVINDYPKTV